MFYLLTILNALIAVSICTAMIRNTGTEIVILYIFDNEVHTPSLNSQFLVNHKNNCDYFNTLDGIPRNIYEHNPNCALSVDS